MRRKKMTFENVELFLAAVAVLYPFDKLAPEVTVAYLPDGVGHNTPGVGVYYASLKRHDDRTGNDFQVIGKATGESLAEALKQLMAQWLAGAEAALKFQAQYAPAGSAGRVVKAVGRKRKAVKRDR